MTVSKKDKFKNDWLNDEGISKMLNRYDDFYGKDYHYTSGDGIFRKENTSNYLVVRFFKSEFYTDKGRMSPSWDLLKHNDLEKYNKLYEMAENDWKSLKLENKFTDYEKHYNNGNTKITPNACRYIKFYGKIDTNNINSPINKTIGSTIRNQPCANCGTTSNMECDHKNPFWMINDKERMSNTKTQLLEDFQPLCGHCNKLHRSETYKTNNSKKRIPSQWSNLPFTSGTEHFDINDPKWYIGTYWGDCKVFNQEVNKRISIN